VALPPVVLAESGGTHHIAAVPEIHAERPTPVSLPDARATDAELRAYIRRNVAYGLFMLLGLLVAVGLAGIFYDEELLAATHWIYSTFGVGGLMFIVFAADGFTAPIPPDLALVVIAKTTLSEWWWAVVPTLGVLSTIAGNIGWALGTRLGTTRLSRFLLGRFRDKHEVLVMRYGSWAVALGAMTPIPFSVTCWAAGIFRMQWRPFFWMSLLRIPRFVIYYLAIAYSERILRLFG
jgi:membrane protein YqaA with SNARE-associated domain